jgi:hypothetical protein
MSSMPMRSALRVTCGALLALLIVTLALAPRHRIAWCRGACCHAVVSACCQARPVPHCCACEHHAVEAVGDSRQPHVRSTCMPGCRVAMLFDLVLQLDGSPVTVDATPVAWLPTLPPSVRTTPPKHRELLPNDRGPPQIDAGAGRRRCDVLLI